LSVTVSLYDVPLTGDRGLTVIAATEIGGAIASDSTRAERWSVPIPAAVGTNDHGNGGRIERVVSNELSCRHLPSAESASQQPNAYPRFGRNGMCSPDPAISYR